MFVPIDLAYALMDTSRNSPDTNGCAEANETLKGIERCWSDQIRSSTERSSFS